MGRHASVLAAALILAGCTPGVPAETATTPPLTSRLDAFAENALANGAPAVVFHVRDGDRQELKAYGVRDLESQGRAEAGDKVWITGAGTPMVAVSVMKLVESGTLGLDDPVSTHLHEFGAIFPGSDGIAVRHLLGSRSGLPDYFPPLAETRTAEELRTGALTFEERLRIAAGVGGAPGPLNYFAWSATDWEVLGWILERKHNRALADVLRSDVFEPAGMDSTHVAVPGQPPEPMLHGYFLSGGSRLDFSRIDVAAGSADAGVISTVEDLSSFFAALAGGRLVRDGTWQTMTRDSSYSLGGIGIEDLCSAGSHAMASGGGFPYAVQSLSSLDGRQQVSVAMVPPPQELNSPDAPPLLAEMEDAVRSTAKDLCSTEAASK
ncbi:serine hydrolase domain-containing protein [Arthrobacter sp. AD-310]